MAEGALKCCLPFVETPTQSTISPIMNLNSPYKTLIKDTPAKTFDPEIRLKEQSNPIGVERVPSNESILFNHSKRSAFQRPVGQKAKDGQNNEKKSGSSVHRNSESEIWNPLFSNTIGIRKILANPNLDLETKNENGDYESIKNDISRLKQYKPQPTKMDVDQKEFCSRPRFPSVRMENVAAKFPPIANPFVPYLSTPYPSVNSILYHQANTLLKNSVYPPSSVFPMSQHFPLFLPVPQSESNKQSISQRLHPGAIIPPLPNRHSLSSQGSQSSSNDESNNVANSSPNDLVSARNKRRQNKLIPEECPFTYEEVVEQVIDDFNQMLEDYRTKEGHPLSEDKKSEYRDLRRRGKNRVAARDSREKKILKTKDLKHRKQYLRQRLSRTRYLVPTIAKMKITKERLLRRAIQEKKLTLFQFTSRFPQDICSSHILPISGGIP